ncbi:EURL protein, partial [Polypterus senegalus]|nr:protein EURL homolog [Polypterus senegalus]XP_039600503.1 protein EURL homolog [Polypterus senegalus]MBN3293878.1 EURL protein [Polypterus senegalus]
MNEEEQFENIDLNDDNVCSVCKLETETGTLSFCHICFDLSIEGVPKSTLLHSTSFRGHRDCFEKYHLIANQKFSIAKSSTSTYKGMKNALSQKISWIVQYAQNKDAVSDLEQKTGKHELLCYTQQGDRKLVPQSDSQVPRYTPRWTEQNGLPEYTKGIFESSQLRLGLISGSGSSYPSDRIMWPGTKRSQESEKQSVESNSSLTRRYKCHTKEELTKMTLEDLAQLNEKLRCQIQVIFEELAQEVQEKDSLTSELHVRHIAIEQLFKNCSKLPWLQIGRARNKASNATLQ